MARHRGSSGYEQAAEAQAQANEPSLVSGVPQSEVPSNGKEGEHRSDPPTNASSVDAHSNQKASVGATPKPGKTKRRMSTGLQICARIERILAELDDKTHNSVLRWIKDIEPRSGNAPAQAQGS